jgi:dihydrodipicolinate synthase/N-acetylneuraminate lyase
MKLQGIFVDATTPFDHAGDLYRIKIEHNIGKWNQTSVAGYVVGGFTGEGALLSAEEKLELWKIAAAAAGAEKMLIAGVDAAGVREASRMANLAAELGYRAALVETTHGR